MQRLGFTVEHKSAARNGDGGVDIFALDTQTSESWAIQCKCYRPDKKLGPSIVRELIGSLAAYPNGTKGMLVATCGISEVARSLAESAEVLVIDGDDLRNLLEHITN